MSMARKLDVAILGFDGQPWERQLHWKESPQAFAAFCLFRDMEPGARTRQKTSDAYAEKYNRSAISTRGSIYKWSSTYRWDERSAAYDAMMDAKDIAERKRQLVKRTRKHAAVMEEAQDLLSQPLKVYAERLKEILAGKREDELLDLSDVELNVLGRAAVKVIIESQRSERESLGAAAPTAEVSGKVAAMRGQVLRRILADKDARTTLEHVQFEIAEAERSESASG